MKDQNLSSNGHSPVIAEQAHRRRTFAIISHPDAGKTTLTEKLLLLGGAIHLAGEVRARGERRRTRSDWLAIEQKRGISVTTSVMTFDYAGCTFNLLDTPGHEDFSEDTYRTLTAVDSAVMVIDAAKGIEPQTRKLFEVCRLRDMPIMTFINKLDRESREPVELLDEIADKLQLDVAPINWPLGMGQNFRGVYELEKRRAVLLNEGADGSTEEILSVDNPRQLESRIPAGVLDAAADELELVDGVLSKFDRQAYEEGHQTPVLFGSALKTFGVRSLLEQLVKFAPSPRSRDSESRSVAPEEASMTGFVFKVQANMDPKHRDRVAFMRICSGEFQRGKKLTLVRSKRQMAVQNPIMFLAQDRTLAEQAFPGDIIGIPNHGQLRVGDSMSEGETIRFKGIPNFAPEILMRVRLGDPMRAKHLQKALHDLAEEGVTQVFRPLIGADWIVGVVGQLQLDVLKTRIESEYNLPIDFEPAPYVTARWCESEDHRVMEKLLNEKKASLAKDGDGNPVFLARNNWDLERMQQDYQSIRFSATRERAL